MTWGLEILFILFILILWIGFFAFPFFASYREEYQNLGVYPTGRYIVRGIAIGTSIGLPVGIAIGSVVVGISLSIPIGLTIGAAWERQHWNEPQTVSTRERKVLWRASAELLAFQLLATGVFILAWMLAVR